MTCVQNNSTLEAKDGLVYVVKNNGACIGGSNLVEGIKSRANIVK